MSSMKVVSLAGGVGGARLSDGLAQLLPSENLCVIVNIGDDFEHLGLQICPDLDTVCYTLAGIANPATGWGRANETWNAYESLAALGGPSWFRLGDRDLGTHLQRTQLLKSGSSLSEVTQRFCRDWGIELTVLPASDDSVPTWVYTDVGELPFQEYFVKRQCHPSVTGFRFDGAEQSQPAPGVLDALREADLVVICPSNPWVSIDPILSIPGIRRMLVSRKVLGVSPIIGGHAVKGPAAKMYAELGIEPSALSVARHFSGILRGFVFDRVDDDSREAVESLGIRSMTTDTLMRGPEGRRRLAQEVLDFGIQLQ